MPSGALKLLTTVGLFALIAYLANTGGDDVAESMLDLGRMPRAEMEIRGFHQLFQGYYVQNDRFPSRPAEVIELFRGNYNKPYAVVGTDPWGSPYRFLNRNWEVDCAGPDFRAGTGDDIIQRYDPGFRPPSVASPGYIIVGERTNNTSASTGGSLDSLESGVMDTVTKTSTALAVFLDGALGDSGELQYEPFTLEEMEEALEVYIAESPQDEQEMALYVDAIDEMMLLHDVFMVFYQSNQRYPAAEEFEDFFTEAFGEDLADRCTDPWGQSYHFLTSEWEIECSGMDRQFGTGDDMVKSYPPGVTRPNILDGAGLQYSP